MIRHLIALVVGWWHRCGICGEHVPGGNVEAHVVIEHSGDLIDLAMDANGQRYTEHTFGFDGDPWRGATILTPGVIADLRERGLLPLTEVNVRTIEGDPR